MKSILSGGRALSPAKALALAVGLAFAATPAMAQAHYMCRATVPPDMTLTPTPDGVVTLSTEGAGPGPRGRYITLDNVFTAEFVNFGSPGTNMVYVIDQRSMKGWSCKHRAR